MYRAGVSIDCLQCCKQEGHKENFSLPQLKQCEGKSIERNFEKREGTIY